LNRLNKVKVKRIYTTSKHINPKTGKEVTRTQQQFDVFQIDFASLNEGLAAIGQKPLACRIVSLFFCIDFFSIVSYDSGVLQQLLTLASTGMVVSSTK
jgi:hypothetical protein